ncbi:MAG: flagellar basal body-associated FliL family protein [Chromatiaceae bacterium]|jgi:flagellar FliL protein|nr:flagellar basal body-associated FliL family protein [Chromatiaceae bacterium]
MKASSLKPRIVSRTAVLLAALCLAFGNAQAAEDEKPAIETGYYALNPSIVSNLSGGPKYIRCDIQLMTEHASQLPKIQLHAPALRHAILMLIAGQDGNQLKTRDGKEGLRRAALMAVQRQLEEFTGDPIVKDLYFTAYYVK